MNRFKTLLQREWMQHQRGWLILMIAPPLLILLVSIFGTLNFSVDVDEDTVIQHVPDALLIALGSVGALAFGTLAISWFSALFQAPGLARRDQQDRSIEFWLSLPTGHAQSLSATLLAHLLLVPWAALLVGASGGLLLSLVLVVKDWGLGTWLTLPWGTIAGVAAVVILRVGVGVLLATLWLSPLILGAMAVSAWFKRFGVPGLAAVIALTGLVLEKFAGTTVVWDVLRGLLAHAGQAVLTGERGAVALKFKPGDDPLAFVQGLPALAVHDLGVALQGLLSPAFVAALAVAALAFAAMVLRRRRGA